MKHVFKSPELTELNVLNLENCCFKSSFFFLNILRYSGSLCFHSFLVPSLQRGGIIKDVYPLHNRQELNALSKTWITAIFREQPLG